VSAQRHRTVLQYPPVRASKRNDPHAILGRQVRSPSVRERPVSVTNKHPAENDSVVTIAGEIDLAVAPALRDQLEALIHAGHSTLYVDLTDATFLDSTALGVLVTAREHCARHGGELHLIVSEPRILKVLEITGLAKTFAIHDSRSALPGTTDGDETDEG
jgi:anti-sigma B factor antagonist